MSERASLQFDMGIRANSLVESVEAEGRRGVAAAQEVNQQLRAAIEARYDKLARWQAIATSRTERQRSMESTGVALRGEEQAELRAAAERQRQIVMETERHAAEARRRTEQAEAESLRRRQAQHDAFHRAARRAFALVSTATVGAFRMAGSAIDAYIQRFPQASSGAQRLKSAVDDLWVSIGRDIAGGNDSGLAGFIKSINSVRMDVVNALSDLISNDPGNAAGVDEALSGDERLSEINRKAAQLRRLQQEAQIGVLRSAGGTRDADALQRQIDLEAYRAEVHRLQSDGDLSFQEARDLIQRREMAVALADQRAMAEGKRFADQQQQQMDERRRALDEQVSDTQAQHQIEIARRQGQEVMAQQLERELSLRQQIRAIENDSNLMSWEKARAIEAINRSHAELEEVIRALPGKDAAGRDTSGGVLGSGLAGSAISRAVVFGGERSESPMLQAARQQTGLLTRIANGIDRLERHRRGFLT